MARNVLAPARATLLGLAVTIAISTFAAAVGAIGVTHRFLRRGKKRNTAATPHSIERSSLLNGMFGKRGVPRLIGVPNTRRLGMPNHQALAGGFDNGAHPTLRK